MGEFQEISACLKDVLHQLGSRPWFKARVLIHLIPKVEGGYTNVELRAFREAAEQAGAGPVWLLKDHPAASDTELGVLFKW
jgi:actin-like ATPase involved in cell morphogenesis